MNALWSDQQQRCLTALGYTLYRRAVATKPMHARGDAQNQQPNMAAAVTIAAQATATSGAVEEASSPALLRALLRAANLDPAAVADAQEWLRAQRIPQLAQLRSDPAAKRVLWPRLRALRRQRESQ
jgi:hypothetical protein